jgi:hypothetical protein
MKIESIKFKAKRLDGKGWVCGYFYEENGNTYIIEDRQKDSVLNRNEAVLIDPTTICQFTGRYAEDYTPIYESDVIECTYFDEQDNDTHVTGVVAWEEDVWGFVLKEYMFENLNVGNRYRGEEYIILPCTDDTESVIKVIGNKFDKKK